MDINHIKRKVTGFLCCLFFLVSCIENDIPYPYREGSITDFLVEGQLDNTLEIDKTKGMVTVEVSDAVDLAALRIKKLTVTNEAEVRIDSAACLDYNAFPRIGFSSLDSLPKSADTRVDFSSSVSLILQTYQEYPWKITVNQTIDRAVQVSNQVGEPVIDLANREMIVYVAKEQHLDRITVTKMQLGGSVGIVVPDPTTVTNYSRPCSFEVTRFGVTETWKVTILHTEGGAVSGGETVAMANRIIVTGMIQEGKIPVIEYREKNPSQTRVDDGWQTLPASSVTVNGTSFTATITGLNPGTTYVYRVVIDDIAGEEVECKTAALVPLTNGGFDDWHQDGKLWNPWLATGVSFWDTGNKGATTLGDSNTIPTGDTSNGTGKAAKLESRFVGVAGIGKFAAGNIFAGSYVRTDGTNGVLSFGRPFETYPTGLKFKYKYTSAEINKSNDSDYNYLLGRPDSCHIYVALSDKAEPYEIKTKKSERQLFSKNDKNVIAYGEFISAKTISGYEEYTIRLDYRDYRKPKYLVIVATASKYGDYFTGGEGSTLYLDEMELTYD